MSTTSSTAIGRAENEVAPGVYRFGSKRVNWYLVDGDDGYTVVDAGLPGHWEQLESGLDALDASLDDVAALVLTHAHPDHIGFAERLRTTADVPVFVHADDRDLALGDGGGGGGSVGGILPNLWRPAVLGLLYEMALDGGFSIPDLETVESYADGDVLDVPGSPRVIHVPGHSPGSCALWFPDREALVSGDAVATVDIRTGRANGPQLMSLFNEDVDRARASLDALEHLGQVTLLPGHGEPWQGDAAAAVDSARSQ